MTISALKSDFEAAVLLKLYQEANNTGYYKSTHDIVNSFSIEVPIMRVKLALEALSDHMWVTYSQSGGGVRSFAITNSGLRQIETLLLDQESFVTKLLRDGDYIIKDGDRYAPASDRIVSLSHNGGPEEKVIKDAEALHKQLKQANDLGTLSREEAEAASAEVLSIANLFRANFIRASAVWRLSAPTLRWIGAKAAETAIGTAAVALLGLIASLIGMVL